MSANNRVVWQEGLFIRPQHFQQESRFLESHANQRLDNSSGFMFGFTQLEIDEGQLNAGVLTITRARGVMPDGTCFNIPGDTDAPEPRKIKDSASAHSIVYLALPIRTGVNAEVQWPGNNNDARYVVEQRDYRDTHSPDGGAHNITTGKLKPHLMLGTDDLSAYSTLAITKISKCDGDGAIEIDKEYYPTCLSVSAAPSLRNFLSEITNMMRSRAKELAGRIGSPEQAGVAEVTDFMLLQTLNRLQPEFQHMYSLRLLHPERLFEAFAKACGELSTFQEETRLPEEYPAYDHMFPRAVFKPLQDTLRRSLKDLTDPRSVYIPLDSQGHGKWTADVKDSSMIKNSNFIIAVKANMDMVQLQQQFVQRGKVSSLEGLRDLIGLQLNGIPLIPQAVAPRQLPYHAGYSYFQLDKSSREWAEMMGSGSAGFAFHISGNFPGLDMQFWAIKEA